MLQLIISVHDLQSSLGFKDISLHYKAIMHIILRHFINCMCRFFLLYILYSYLNCTCLCANKYYIYINNYHRAEYNGNTSNSEAWISKENIQCLEIYHNSKSIGRLNFTLYYQI